MLVYVRIIWWEFSWAAWGHSWVTGGRGGGAGGAQGWGGALRTKPCSGPKAVNDTKTQGGGGGRTRQLSKLLLPLIIYCRSCVTADNTASGSPWWMHPLNAHWGCLSFFLPATQRCFKVYEATTEKKKRRERKQDVRSGNYLSSWQEL